MAGSVSSTSRIRSAQAAARGAVMKTYIAIMMAIRICRM